MPLTSTVGVVATDGAGSEAGSEPIAFTVARMGDNSGAVAIMLAWSGTTTYGVDYTFTATAGTLAPDGRTLTLQAGVASAVVTVAPMDDTLYEGAETAVLAVLAGTGYVLGSQTSASGTIADNDAAPVLPVVGVEATDEIGAETGAGVARDTITFTLTCTGDVSRTLVEGFGWFGTAKLGKAFTASVSAGGVLSKTTVTLAAGVSSVTITITPIDDTTVEAVENVVFTLKAGTAYTLGTSSATGTIADNDGKAAKMASTSTSSSSTSLTSTDTSLTSTGTSLTSTGTAPGKSQFSATAV